MKILKLNQNPFWVVVSSIFYFHPYLGKWSKLTHIFQMGWNHQPENLLDWFFWRDIFLNYNRTMGVNPRSDKTHQIGRAFAWGPFPGKHRNCKSKTPKRPKRQKKPWGWWMHLHEKIVDVDVLSWLVIFFGGVVFFLFKRRFLGGFKKLDSVFFGWNTVSVHMPNWGFGGLICGTMTIDVRWFLLSQGTPSLRTRKKIGAWK